MIIYEHGDLLRADTEALINTINCVGVMGKGVALQFKLTYPDNFKAYKIACDKHEVRPGRMFIYNTNYTTNPKYIINFPTKRHWRDYSRIDDIEIGLDALVHDIKNLNIKSIAIPPLGCGNGGLDWSVICPIIKQKLDVLSDIKILIFEPHPTKHNSFPPF